MLASPGVLDEPKQEQPMVIPTRPTFIQTTQDTTLTSLNLAFSLTTALAWNEAIKSLVNKYVMSKNMQYYHVLYAAFVTLLSGLFIFFTRKSSKKTTKILS